MTKSRTLLFLLPVLLLFVFSGPTADAQNVPNTANLQKMAASLSARNAATMRLLKQKGWPLIIRNKKGRLGFLHGIDALGNPLYVTTNDNIISAATIRTSSLWPGGSTGLNLNGSSANMKSKIAVWDEGLVRPTHVELVGRVTQVDNSPTLSDHSTHVSGTLIASGVNPVAKGMSNGAQQLLCYDFDNDESEMAAAAAKGLLISSHSYADIAGWYLDGNNLWEWYGNSGDTVDIKFGLYDTDTQIWDSIAYNAPNYLIFKAGGNNRGEQGPDVGQPYYRPTANGGVINAGNRPANLSNNGGFNTIATYGCAKNIVTLGAVNPIPGGYSSPSDVVLADFSSLGPTGDGRIKPDLVADGVNLLSSISTADNAYDVYSGTSMATPSAAGSSFLMQEYYSKEHSGQFMWSSTLRGLLIHTADEAGSAPGPDYSYGWGLLNMQKAAAVITADATDQTQQIIQSNLSGTTPVTYTITASGKLPVVATLCWTDPPGTPVTIPSGSHNFQDVTIKLVNDLDLRITDNTTGKVYMPWILDPTHPGAAATKGDNIRDNVEKVELSDSLIPGRTYTITVSHKGTLARSGTQAYSLLISGGGGTAVCTSASTAAGPSIDKVTIGTTSNTLPTGACRNYTDLTANAAFALPIGQATSFAIANSSCNSTTNNRNISIWIDYNNNGTFDAGELVASASAIAPGTFSGTITSPTTVTTGTYTRMRIVIEDVASGTPTACGTYGAGETQDYRVVFTNPLNDVGVTAIEDPSLTACANDSQIVAIHIRNFGTVPQLGGVPVTTTITSGATTVATLTATCMDSIPAGGEVIFTYNKTVALAASTSYTFTSTTSLSTDGNPSNNSNTSTITTNAVEPAVSGTATICGSNATSVVLKATTTGDDLPVWYDSQTSTTPIAAGNVTTTTEITSNKTYYVAVNDLKMKGGVPNKNYLATTGTPGLYYPFGGQYMSLTTGVPLTIESARLYVGHYGQVTFSLGTPATDSTYYPLYNTTIDVYATKQVPASGRVAGIAGDNSDTGAIYYLNIPVPNPGNYILLAICSDSTNLYVNEDINKNPYPISIPGVFSVTGNSNTDQSNAKDTLYYQKFYFPLYDIGIRLDGCPGPRSAVTATTEASPTIQQTGANILTSSAATGNQWYVNDSLMVDSTSQSIQASFPGAYYSVVTDPNTGCMLQSNTINYTPGGGGNASIGLKVAANPVTTGSFTLQFVMSTTDNTSIELYNTLGQKVYEEDYANFTGYYSKSINVGRLASGVYVLRIVHGGSTYHTEIFIRN